MPVKRKIGTFIDYLNIIGSTIFIILFLIMLVGSVRFWNFVYPDTGQIELRLFWTAIIMSILTTGSQWIIGRMKSIADSFDLIIKARRLKKWRKMKRNPRKK